MKGDVFLQSVDAMSLARCLFEELWLPVTCPGWNFEDAPAPEANLRIINMAPMPALLEAMQESLRWKLLPAQVKEQTNLWTEMCYRALEDGRFIICRWPVRHPSLRLSSTSLHGNFGSALLSVSTDNPAGPAAFRQRTQTLWTANRSTGELGSWNQRYPSNSPHMICRFLRNVTLAMSHLSTSEAHRGQ
mmetsp:Transcript_17483/g.48767  ORF Transcript_17483/g.48767 Transcript_17483/m.48767 type:complete len:189 (-) Transcript_17483:687-1253(-)